MHYRIKAGGLLPCLLLAGVLSFSVLGDPLPSYKPKAYSSPPDINQRLRNIFRGSDDNISKEVLLPSLEKLFQYEARESDLEMMAAVAKDFLRSKANEPLSFENILRYFESGEVTRFIENWRMNMYMTLIKLYDIKYDEKMLKETLEDPDFYGLTYDAYKIMTYKINEDEDPETLPPLDLGGDDLEKLYKETKIEGMRDFEVPKIPVKDYEDILNEFKEEMRDFVKLSGIPFPEIKDDL